MFNTPIKHVRFNSMEELLKFSYWTENKANPFTWCQNNGQIAFAVATGNVYVTPYRPEIHELLQLNGYREGSIYVPFSNGFKKQSPFYEWLVKIADQECWAYTYEKAFQVSTQRGIKPVIQTTSNFRIKEVAQFQSESDYSFSPMVSLYLMNNTDQNVATYIVVDERTVLLCDEYGRTFIVRAKIIINDFVNALIDAGYTRTTHPEYYVKDAKSPDTGK